MRTLTAEVVLLPCLSLSLRVKPGRTMVSLMGSSRDTGAGSRVKDTAADGTTV